MKNKQLLKYTFANCKYLALENDEPIIKTLEPKTFYFSLLHGGTQIFEQLYNCSIMGAINAFNIADTDEVQRIEREVKNEEARKKAIEKYQRENKRAEMLEMLSNTRFICALIASSYLKIENGLIICNAITANEILESPYIETMANDQIFKNKLIEMVISCISDENQKNKQPQGKPNPNKKKEK